MQMFLLSDDQLDEVAGGAPREEFFVDGSPSLVSPGQPAGGGPAEVTREGDSDTGRPDVVLTPGAPFTVFPGGQAR